jgi:hypothetical protein
MTVDLSSAAPSHRAAPGRRVVEAEVAPPAPEAGRRVQARPTAIDARRWAKAGAVLVALALAVASCGPDPATPRGTAERFLDAYFGLDRETALATSAHRAHEMVEEERRLTAGQAVDAETRVPAIRYRLLREERPSDTTAHLVYRVRVAVPDAETTEQRWLVTVARVEGEWKVVMFERLPG